MRVRLGAALRHPNWLADWWIDLPMRRRSWWSEVLRDERAGWLRWKPAWRERISYEPPDLDQWVVYPPLHRLYLMLRHRTSFASLKDDERKRLFR